MGTANYRVAAGFGILDGVAGHIGLCDFSISAMSPAPCGRLSRNVFDVATHYSNLRFAQMITLNRGLLEIGIGADVMLSQIESIKLIFFIGA